MTYKAYLDNVYAKTGRTPEDYVRAAKAKGLVTFGGFNILWNFLQSDLRRSAAAAVTSTPAMTLDVTETGGSKSTRMVVS